MGPSKENTGSKPEDRKETTMKKLFAKIEKALEVYYKSFVK